MRHRRGDEIEAGAMAADDDEIGHRAHAGVNSVISVSELAGI
jgi:hypothetical protein